MKADADQRPRTIAGGLSRLLAIPLSIRLAATLWVVLTVAVTVRVAVQRPDRASVVPIYLDAGERWRAGASLYEHHPGLDVYRNPPGVAAGFAALTPLPPKVAAILWRLGCGAALLTGLVRFRRVVAPDLSADRAAALYALAAVLAVPAVNNGQVNILVAAGGLHGAAAVARGRWWAAALWFAVGGWLKVYPLAVGMLAAVVAPRRLAPKLAAATVAGFLAPFVVQSPDYVWRQHREMIAADTADDRTHADPARVPRDWTILSRTWAGVVVPATAAKGVSLVVAAGLAGFMAVTAGRRSLRDSAGVALALGSGWMTAFGPATEGNTYSVLCGAAAWLAVVPDRPRWATWAARVGCGLLVMSVARGMVPGVIPFELLGPQPAGALLLMLAAFAAAPQPVVSAAGQVIITGRVSQSARGSIGGGNDAARPVGAGGRDVSGAGGI
ncbi:MAG: glycosyltransferase family 87 protein [Gemmataceae bacterium]